MEGTFTSIFDGEYDRRPAGLFFPCILVGIIVGKAGPGTQKSRFCRGKCGQCVGSVCNLNCTIFLVTLNSHFIVGPNKDVPISRQGDTFPHQPQRESCSPTHAAHFSIFRVSDPLYPYEGWWSSRLVQTISDPSEKVAHLGERNNFRERHLPSIGLNRALRLHQVRVSTPDYHHWYRWSWWVATSPRKFLISVSVTTFLSGTTLNQPDWQATAQSVEHCYCGL